MSPPAELASATSFGTGDHIPGMDLNDLAHRPYEPMTVEMPVARATDIQAAPTDSGYASLGRAHSKEDIAGYSRSPKAMSIDANEGCCDCILSCPERVRGRRRDVHFTIFRRTCQLRLF